MDKSVFGQGFENLYGPHSGSNIIDYPQTPIGETEEIRLDSTQLPEILDEPKIRRKKGKIKEVYLTLDDLSNPNLLEFPTRLTVLGPSQSGKTNVIRCLVKQLAHKFDFIFMFSPNEHEEGWLPRECRHNEIDFIKIKRIWTFARKHNGKYSILIIIDDPMGANFHNSKFLDKFITTSRHQNISLIIGMQYINAVPPCFRHNMKQYIICNANEETCNALKGLSTSIINKWDFNNFISRAKKGRVVYLDFVPGNNQMNFLEIPLCKNFKIKI